MLTRLSDQPKTMLDQTTTPATAAAPAASDADSHLDADEARGKVGSVPTGSPRLWVTPIAVVKNPSRHVRTPSSMVTDAQIDEARRREEALQQYEKDPNAPSARCIVAGSRL